MTRAPSLQLGLPGFTLDDLHDPAGLERLFRAFRDDLLRADADLARRYAAWLPNGQDDDEAGLLIEVATHLSRFLCTLFGVADEAARRGETLRAGRDLFAFRKQFVARRAARRKGDEPLDAATLEAQLAERLGGPLDEAGLARAVLERLAAPEGKEQTLELAERAVAAFLREGHHADWPSLKLQHKVDFDQLVPTVPAPHVSPTALEGPAEDLRHRDGFALTDDRGTLGERLRHVDQCLFCHARGVDSCRNGLRDRQGDIQPNPLGIPLNGCPLDERISEAQLLLDRGDAVASLAMIVLDNPMCPGTGHRICNDCMKACIFQKQEPVDIPRVETGTLTDVLDLPWGVEIYGLLTRFNPLNRLRPHALPYNGCNVLVVGLGPAGYTLAHFLLNEGFGVVGVDGLKIEPLPRRWLDAAVRDFADLTGPLQDRVPSGFGGVSEYGITVRWDKNFLSLIHLTLARRETFRAYGGVRFGGTITLRDAWETGFHHVAIAAGAGRPTIVSMKNNLTRGVRKASDFLMALQLTGAFRTDALANLQVELPALVIGGGLTAIDTATELLAYYPVQVERLLHRHERLDPEQDPRDAMSEAEAAVYERMLGHARELRAEREAAETEGRAPDFLPLLNRWGGVALCYRKGLKDSPAYRLNHEEVVKALEEGIRYVEDVSPLEAVDDDQDGLQEVVFDVCARGQDGRWTATGERLTLPARSLFVAAGTSPNTIYEKEHRGTFELDERGRFFRTHGSDGRADPEGFFTSHDDEGRRVSFLGDNHPVYAGSVVKAMASARDGYREIAGLFANRLGQAGARSAWQGLVQRLDEGLKAEVVRVDRLTPTIVEVIVKAPWAARAFRPGQFYRLQNYEARAPERRGQRLVMEGIALTGAWVDTEQGLLSLIVLEMGGSSSLCQYLEPGEPVVVMGPTGTPTEIPSGETVALLGGGLGNAVLFSIAAALKRNGNRVLYFAGYKHSRDVFKRAEIESGTDVVVWCCDTGPAIQPGRRNDRFHQANIVQTMAAYGRGDLGQPTIPLADVQRLIVIGSDGMMNAVRQARRSVLAPFLGEHVAIGSINSPMQCMLKEVCAQCLQRHVDPETGEPAEPVFSCFNQDQELDRVDFPNLRERLAANSVLEKATRAWIAHLTAAEPVGAAG